MSSGFRIPEASGAQLQSTLPTGQLVIECPHWSAEVHVFDNVSRPVPGIAASRRSETRPDMFEIRVELRPGIYDVELRLAGCSDTECVTVRAGTETRVPKAR